MADFLSIYITGIEEDYKKDNFTVELIPDGIKIRGEIGDRIGVYDILGRLRKEIILGIDEKVLKIERGVYFLRSYRSKIVKKVIVI